MKRKIQKNNNGFSLLELLICIAISGFIILAAYSLVMVGTKSYDTANKTTTVQQEVAFATNLIGENIRTGKANLTSITKDRDNREIHTGRKVIYYDKTNSSLYIYDETGAGIGDSTYTSGNDDNLISKYVTSFDVNFVETESSAAMPDYSTTVTGYSSLIKITMKVQIRDKSDSSEVIYEIRNDS